jgi:hypothetical protein
MNIDDLLYIGIEIDENSQNELLNISKPYIDKYNKYISEWFPIFIAHHMTISF